MFKTFNSLFVTMFGLGKVKIIPGTFGSLATIIILYIFFHILNISSNLILLFLVVIFIYSFSAVANHIKDNKNKDELDSLLIDKVNAVLKPVKMIASELSEKHTTIRLLTSSLSGFKRGNINANKKVYDGRRRNESVGRAQGIICSNGGFDSSDEESNIYQLAFEMKDNDRMGDNDDESNRFSRCYKPNNEASNLRQSLPK